jgi:putative transposase
MAAEHDDFRVGRHVVYRLHAHIVLITKYRRGVLTDRVRELLITTAREVCEHHGAMLVEADGETDHLHLLIDYPPKVALARLVGAIKTNTSKRVREQNWPEVRRALWGEHFWSPSYCVVSTGGAPIETVRRYIQQQREPNRKPGRPSSEPRRERTG